MRKGAAPSRSRNTGNILSGDRKIIPVNQETPSKIFSEKLRLRYFRETSSGFVICESLIIISACYQDIVYVSLFRMDAQSAPDSAPVP